MKMKFFLRRYIRFRIGGFALCERLKAAKCKCDKIKHFKFVGFQDRTRYA